MPHPSKKRKRDVVLHQDNRPVDTAKPTAVFKPTTGRNWTLSIALPGSVVANAQNHDAKCHIVGQIARASAVFSVDEVVIFNDGQSHKSRGYNDRYNDRYQEHRDKEVDPDHQYTGFSNPDHFLYHLLSYVECPPPLRKHLFPLHPNLRTAGMLPSLDMPHHPRPGENLPYREGVTVEEPSGGMGNDALSTKKPKKEKKHQKFETAPVSWVDTGLRSYSRLEGVEIPPSTRVTLKMAPDSHSTGDNASGATAVDPAEPREDQGYYWGYSTRIAENLSAVFTECAFDGGYDVSVGFSERGISLADVDPSRGKGNHESDVKVLPPFRHLLLVFGGVAGLEVAVDSDEELKRHGVNDASEVFDYWINLFEGQGSRTIRTEEAVWLGLMGLREYVTSNGR